MVARCTCPSLTTAPALVAFVSFHEVIVHQRKKSTMNENSLSFPSLLWLCHNGQHCRDRLACTAIVARLACVEVHPHQHLHQIVGITG